MKNFKLLLVLAVAAFAGACNNDDDKSGNTGLNGKWYLIKAMSPESAIGEDFQKGSITWTINESQHKVNTEDTRISIPEETSMYSLPNNTYNYMVAPWGGACNEAFYIDELNFGCITINGNSLILTTEAADGLSYSFVR